ncbi:MAG: DNA-binding transcriptional regulator [Kiritimatiellae bacterium]|nr:DNA-binding transcriptional regulator [Kiritimatiellia bacterium]
MRIGIFIETNRAHGRALLEGIGDYALARRGWPEWRLEAIEPATFADAELMRSFDGFIVRIMDDQAESALLRTGKPVIDTYGRKDVARIPYIRLDDASIAAMAAKIFADHRYARCAFCGFPGLRFSEARGRCFTIASQDYGAECFTYNGSGKVADKAIGREKIGAPADAPALRQWLRSIPKPIAIFCCSDLRALHLLNACADAGIDVPHDVAILGCDNDKVLCNFANPPLSSIDTDALSLGRQAAQLLDALMSGSDGAIAKPKAGIRDGRIPHLNLTNGSNGKKQGVPAAVLHSPLRVIERASTDFYQVRTPWLSDALVHIRRHVGGGLNATELCRHLGYSHTTVNKVFRAELGETVKQCLMRQRMERACRLLRETDRTAASIAASCGYPSAQYFAHVFAAKFHTTPDRWRRKWCGTSKSKFMV